MRPSYTALFLPVAEAAFLQPFRTKHIRGPAATLSPHITLHSPFKSFEQIASHNLRELRHLFSAYPRFTFTLSGTDRFEKKGILYLRPEPSEPFEILSRAIQAAFPDAAPDFRDPVMHLTLARTKLSDLDRTESAFHAEYKTRLPIHATATQVCLYEKRENVWHLRNAFGLSSIIPDTGS